MTLKFTIVNSLRMAHISLFKASHAAAHSRILPQKNEGLERLKILSSAAHKIHQISTTEGEKILPHLHVKNQEFSGIFIIST